MFLGTFVASVPLLLPGCAPGPVEEAWVEVYSRKTGEPRVSAVVAGRSSEGLLIRVFSSREEIGAFRVDEEGAVTRDASATFTGALAPGARFVHSPSRRFLGRQEPVGGERLGTRLAVLVDLEGEVLELELAGAPEVQMADDGEHLILLERDLSAEERFRVRVLDLRGVERDEIVKDFPGVVRFSQDAQRKVFRNKTGLDVYEGSDWLYQIPACLEFWLSSDGSTLSSSWKEELLFYDLSSAEEPKVLPPVPSGDPPVAVEFSGDGRALVLTHRVARLHELTEGAGEDVILATLPGAGEGEPQGERFTSGAWLVTPEEGGAAVVVGSRSVLVPAIDLDGLAKPVPAQALGRVRLFGAAGEGLGEIELELADWTFDQPRVQVTDEGDVVVVTADQVFALVEL